MPMACKVCSRTDLIETVDLAITRGEPIRQIAARTDLAEASVRRHAKNHLPADLAKSEAARRVCRRDQLLADLVDRRDHARRLTQRAEAEGDLRTALAGIRVDVAVAELLARIAGELDEAARVEIHQHRTLRVDASPEALGQAIAMAMDALGQAAGKAGEVEQPRLPEAADEDAELRPWSSRQALDDAEVAVTIPGLVRFPESRTFDRGF